LLDASKAKMELVQPLLAEANELTAITASSIKTARRNSN
jgi:hypothetical protein